MPNGDKPTVNQHIVPVVYLKNFSLDEKNLFFYDIEKDYLSDKAVPIKSILFKKISMRYMMLKMRLFTIII